MRKIVLFILIILAMSSCLSVKRIQRNCDKFAAVCITDTEKETVTEYRDTTIYVDREVEVFLPADTAMIRSRLSFGNILKRITARKGIVEVTAKIEDSVLSVDAYIADSTYIYNLQDSIRILNGIKQTVIKETNTVTVKEDTNFGKFAKKWFWGSVILVVLFAGYIIVRIYLKK